MSLPWECPWSGYPTVPHLWEVEWDVTVVTEDLNADYVLYWNTGFKKNTLRLFMYTYTYIYIHAYICMCVCVMHDPWLKDRYNKDYWSYLYTMYFSIHLCYISWFDSLLLVCFPRVSPLDSPFALSSLHLGISRLSGYDSGESPLPPTATILCCCVTHYIYVCLCSVYLAAVCTRVSPGDQ